MNLNLKTKTPNFQKWGDNIRLMITVDNINFDDIKKVIEYSQNDTFWKSNIRSTAKLRKQFDTLYMQMQQKNKYTYSNNNNNNNDTFLDSLGG